MKNLEKIVLSVIATVTLSGCAHINSNFDCPMKEGIRCQSLDEVNAAIDRGEIGGSVLPVKIQQPIYHESSLIQYKGGSTGRRSPVRYPEDVMRIWVAPYEDSDGNYHQASSIYTVTREGYWIGVPPKEIREE